MGSIIKYKQCNRPDEERTYSPDTDDQAVSIFNEWKQEVRDARTDENGPPHFTAVSLVTQDGVVLNSTSGKCKCTDPF